MRYHLQMDSLSGQADKHSYIRFNMFTISTPFFTGIYKPAEIYA